MHTVKSMNKNMYGNECFTSMFSIIELVKKPDRQS